MLLITQHAVSPQPRCGWLTAGVTYGHCGLFTAQPSCFLLILIVLSCDTFFDFAFPFFALFLQPLLSRDSSLAFCLVADAYWWRLFPPFSHVYALLTLTPRPQRRSLPLFFVFGTSLSAVFRCFVPVPWWLSSCRMFCEYCCWFAPLHCQFLLASLWLLNRAALLVCWHALDVRFCPFFREFSGGVAALDCGGTNMDLFRGPHFVYRSSALLPCLGKISTGELARRYLCNRFDLLLASNDSPGHVGLHLALASSQYLLARIISICV